MYDRIIARSKLRRQGFPIIITNYTFTETQMTFVFSH